MSKSEANPKSEIRKTTAHGGIGESDLARRQHSKSHRCLLIYGGESTRASFCFSAARPHRKGSYRNGSGHGVGMRRFQSAAEKQKKEEAGASYKQGTPTGLGPKGGTVDFELGRNDAVGERPSASPLGGTVDRFGLEKLFGVCDRSRVKEAIAGSPLRSAPALHRVELNRSGLVYSDSESVSNFEFFSA
jgi:hypothetical protein